MTIDWKYIILFVLLALGLSYPVQSGQLPSIFQDLLAGSFLDGAT